MDKLSLRIAGVLSFIAIFLHEFVGAPMVLPPLATSQLTPETIALHHFSWHVGSVAIATMAVLFLCASVRPMQLAMAVIATAMCGGFALLSVLLAVFSHQALWATPAPYLWSVNNGFWSCRLLLVSEKIIRILPQAFCYHFIHIFRQTLFSKYIFQALLHRACGVRLILLPTR